MHVFIPSRHRDEYSRALVEAMSSQAPVDGGAIGRVRQALEYLHRLLSLRCPSSCASYEAAWLH